MPDLLLELFSEEIPARMQRKGADDLKKLITDGLVAAGLTYDGARGFATPRRLTLSVTGIPNRSPDSHEERKGPRVGSPDGAIQGFLRGAGLTSIDEAEIVSDGKKGEVYVARIHKHGRPAIEVIADLVPQVIRTFPWPKSQRWGSGTLRWVRPLHSILCTFGPETEEPDIVPFEVDGIRSGNTTHGHRFMAPDVITVKRFDDYVAKLQNAFVVLDADRRKDIILHDAKDLAFASGLELIQDDGLLEEVAGLVEWPVVLMGEFDERFLDVPGEVIRATIRANQKCFVLRGSNGAVSNKFLLVSNVVPNDGGDAIRHGNGRVVRARLSDALYFWETDQKDLPGYEDFPGSKLDQRMEKIRRLNIVFHEKLGTQGERVERIKRLAQELAPLVGADPAKALRAAELAKADLVTEVVGEFPEVQGLMGRRYAELQGEDASVCAAIEDHYKPQGPSDRVPTDPVAIAVALADKLDTLVGFWAIDEKPTGSKDPYALRRAALGVVRIILENGLRLDLEAAVYWGLISLIYSRSPDHSAYGYREMGTHTNIEREPNFDADWRRVPFYTFLNGDGFFDLRAGDAEAYQVGNPDIDGIPDLTDEEAVIISRRREAFDELENRLAILDNISLHIVFERPGEPDLSGLAAYVRSNETRFFLRQNRIIADLLAFFHDRLKVQLRESGIRHDLVDAVLSPAPLSLSLPHKGGGDDAARAGASITGSASADPVGTITDAALVPSPLVGEGQGEGFAAPSQTSDLVLIVKRVEALSAFLATEDGKNLLSGYNRAANILKAEEKKSGETYSGGIDFGKLEEPEEIALAKAIEGTISSVKAALSVENFGSAMSALASLRAPVDAFFDKILVNSPDPALRLNRLKLLTRIRDACHQVADFSKIA